MHVLLPFYKLPLLGEITFICYVLYYIYISYVLHLCLILYQIYILHALHLFLTLSIFILFDIIHSSSLVLKCALRESGCRIGYELTKMNRDHFWRSTSNDTNLEVSAFLISFYVHISVLCIHTCS